MKYTLKIYWLYFEILESIQLFSFRQSLGVKARGNTTIITIQNDLREHCFFSYLLITNYFQIKDFQFFFEHTICKGWWKERSYDSVRLLCRFCKTGCLIQPISQQTGVSITKPTFLHPILIETHVAGCLRTNAKY